MRLIDADAFRRELDNHWPFTKEEQSKHGFADMAKSTVLFVLNKMPTIEERKTGKWIETRTWEHDGEIYCEQCGSDAPTEGDYRQVKTNYCPNCGADMRGEE